MSLSIPMPSQVMQQPDGPRFLRDTRWASSITPVGLAITNTSLNQFLNTYVPRIAWPLFLNYVAAWSLQERAARPTLLLRPWYSRNIPMSGEQIVKKTSLSSSILSLTIVLKKLWPAFQKELDMQTRFQSAWYIRKMVDKIPASSDLPGMMVL